MNGLGTLRRLILSAIDSGDYSDVRPYARENAFEIAESMGGTEFGLRATLARDADDETCARTLLTAIDQARACARSVKSEQRNRRAQDAANTIGAGATYDFGKHAIDFDALLECLTTPSEFLTFTCGDTYTFDVPMSRLLPLRTLRYVSESVSRAWVDIDGLHIRWSAERTGFRNSGWGGGLNLIDRSEVWVRGGKWVPASQDSSRSRVVVAFGTIVKSAPTTPISYAEALQFAADFAA